MFVAQSIELAGGSGLKAFMSRGHASLDGVEGQNIVIFLIVVLIL